MKNFLIKIKDKLFGEIFPKIKEKFSSYSTKQKLIIIGIILVIAGLIFGSVKYYEYSKTAYLKEYSEKYNMEFPEGILEEMCDSYGQDQTVIGRVEIGDINKSIDVSSIIKDNKAFFDNGGDINKDQHFRSIRLSDKKLDIEKLYSTTDAYLKASQKITFSTLFEKSPYKVIAAYYINTKPEDDDGYVFPYNFSGNMSNKDFESFEDRITHRTLYKTDYVYSSSDYFLSISAPSDFMKDFRFVIVCVKTDEKEFEKTENATTNERVYYPQVWYDKNGVNNPYIFAGKWKPKAI